MVVQHNLQAINSNRMLGITQGTLSSSTEKLSSGYKINRAADNAAGLTISEKMRKQIRGLTQASTNAEDGVSAVQTAEGALTEVHDMLQRMNELAVQASNGTNSESDRQAIQDEIDQLVTEIDRVSETTKFNEIYLLKGNAEGNKSTNLVAAHDAGIDGKLIDNENGTYSFELEKELKVGDKIKIGGQEYEIGKSKNKLDYIAEDDLASLSSDKLKAGDSITKADGTTKTVVEKLTKGGITAMTWAADDTITLADADGNETTYTIAGATDLTKNQIAAADLEKILKSGSTITNMSNAAVKAAAADYNNIVGMKIEELGEDELNIFDPKVATATTAKTTAIDEFKAATVGDSFVLGGKAQEVVAGTPSSYDDLKKALEALGEDAWVVVGEDTLTGKPNVYQIATGKGDEPEEDVADGYQKLTVDQILDRIKEGDTVRTYASLTDDDADGVLDDPDELDTADETYTAIGISDTNDKDTITAEEAYRKITDELAKASSIGTDTGAEAEYLGNGKFQIKQGTVEYKDSLAFNLHVGADADMTNKIMVNIESMSAASLGIKNLNVKDLTGNDATYAIDAIADAVAKVSAQRSALGAVQNRLEHTISNLDNVVENTTAAESRIRDTDMATEMVQYSNANILAQAGQSMLAQANQSNQGVLSLLG